MEKGEGRSVRILMRDGKFVHQFWEKGKLSWECVSYLIEAQEVYLNWLEKNEHPVWTYR